MKQVIENQLLFDTVIECVQNVLTGGDAVHREQISGGQTLRELGFDSLDIQELTYSLEESLDIVLDEFEVHHDGEITLLALYELVESKIKKKRKRA